MKTTDEPESRVHRLLQNKEAPCLGDKQAQIGLLPSPVGRMVCVADTAHVYLLQFEDQPSLRQSLDKLLRLHRFQLDWTANPLIQTVHQQLQCYFAGDLIDFDLPLHLSGTPFQKKVWKQLQDIPYGSTCSYRELAVALQKPKGYRAVAQANASNLLSIVVPCHRVVNTGGGLGGYAGGIDRKAKLLDLESSS